MPLAMGAAGIFLASADQLASSKRSAVPARRSSLIGPGIGLVSVVICGTVNCTMMRLPRWTAERSPIFAGTLANGGGGLAPGGHAGHTHARHQRRRPP